VLLWFLVVRLGLFISTQEAVDFTTLFLPRR
jgi:hypothetical protein